MNTVHFIIGSFVVVMVLCAVVLVPRLGRESVPEGGPRVREESGVSYV